MTQDAPDAPIEAPDQETQEPQETPETPMAPWSFDSTPQALQIYRGEFSGTRDSLSAIRQLVETAAASAPLEELEAAAFQMAVDEICANIIEHGYEKQESQHDDGRTLVIEIALFGDRIETIITDRLALRFDIASAQTPGLEAFLEEERARGLGLDIVYRCVDKIECQWLQPQGNQTRLVKFYNSQS